MTLAAVRLNRNVIGLLRRGYAGGMAGGAVVAIDTDVAEADPGKGVEVGSAVTSRAVQGCRHMVHRFPRSNAGIMAR